LEEFKKKLLESVDYLRKLGIEEPDVSIILGSGLGGLATRIRVEHSIPYWEIPNFPISTVRGHEGRLLIGKLGGKKVIAMQGRFHYYEGYSMREITHPVRVIRMIGCKTLIVSNAAGGVNPRFKKGDIMLIEDHINLLPENPLRGPHDETLGPRFPSLDNAYDRKLREIAEKVAMEYRIPLVKGVYVALQGPNLETPAEYQMVRVLGGDAVGMSTVPEVIVANQMGMRVLGFSVITNIGNPYTPSPASHEEVMEVAKNAEDRLSKLIEGVIARI